MQKYDAIGSGIKNNDISILRECVSNIIYASRNFSSGEFDEMVRYVESKGIKLKDDSLVGDPPISSQKSSFTDEDFARAIFELKRNFCDKRIEDVKHIGRTLYPSKPKSNGASPAGKSSDSTGTLPNQQSHQQKGNTPMIAGLVAVVIMIVIVILLVRR